MSKNLEIAEKCPLGNTELMGTQDNGKKAIAWCFTSFEKTEPEFIAEKFRYLCYSPEICPTTNRPHFQGYFYLKNEMTLKAIKKKINASWKLTKANGTALQNKIYCGFENYEKDGKIKIKNENFKEFGDMPSQGKRTDLKELNERIKKGTTVKQIRQECPMTYHLYGRTLEKLEEDFFVDSFNQAERQMPSCTWYYGPTGVGKSHKAYENFNVENCYVYNFRDGGFWEGYTNQKRIIINELRGEIPFSELLQICDKWYYPCKRKGKGCVPLNASEIIITSCKHPSEIYHRSLDDDEKLDQLIRRLNIIFLEPPKVDE